MKISIITPCYNELENVGFFYDKLKGVLEGSGQEWDWIIVDDHSDQDTFSRVRDLCSSHQNIRVIRLARNYGSHVAALSGIQNCASDAAVVMAMDLQDHPSYILELIRNSTDVSVVWARRNKNYSRGSIVSDLPSRIYYRIMHFLLGKDVSPNGADFFLIKRNVISEIKKISFSDINIIDLIHNLGFNNRSITYEKSPRLHGKSKWTFTRRVNLFISSIVMNSALPLRVMGIIGTLVSLFGFTFSVLVVRAFYQGSPYPGWASLIVAVLIIGGLILINLSILGEYIWRIMKNTKSIPVYTIEEKINL